MLAAGAAGISRGLVDVNANRQHGGLELRDFYLQASSFHLFSRVGEMTPKSENKTRKVIPEVSRQYVTDVYMP